MKGETNLSKINKLYKKKENSMMLRLTLRLKLSNLKVTTVELNKRYPINKIMVLLEMIRFKAIQISNKRWVLIKEDCPKRNSVILVNQ
jgi:hypothetical protein